MDQGRMLLTRVLDSEVGRPPEVRADLLAGLGTIVFRQGDNDEAERLFGESVAVAQTLDPLRHVNALCDLSRVALRRGRIDYWVVLLGAILPDLIDKPIGRIFLESHYPSPNIYLSRRKCAKRSRSSRSTRYACRSLLPGSPLTSKAWTAGRNPEGSKGKPRS
jgi:hypothetical protein